MSKLIDDRFKEISHYQIWFGKHKGKNFDEIPLNYLDWLSGETGGTEAFQFAVQAAKEYLSYDVVQKQLEEEGRK